MLAIKRNGSAAGEIASRTKVGIQIEINSDTNRESPHDGMESLGEILRIGATAWQSTRAKHRDTTDAKHRHPVNVEF